MEIDNSGQILSINVSAKTIKTNTVVTANNTIIKARGFSEEEIARILDFKDNWCYQSRMTLSNAWAGLPTNDAFFTSGYFSNAYHRDKQTDIDVYFNTIKSATETMKYFRKEGVNPEKAGKYGIGNRFKITAQNDYHFDIICFNTGLPSEVTKKFDFDHCKWYYDCGNNKLYISRHIFDCIRLKKLYTSQKEVRPKRMLKYMERGYMIGDDPISVVDEYGIKPLGERTFDYLVPPKATISQLQNMIKNRG